MHFNISPHLLFRKSYFILVNKLLLQCTYFWKTFTFSCNTYLKVHWIAANDSVTIYSVQLSSRIAIHILAQIKRTFKMDSIYCIFEIRSLFSFHLYLPNISVLYVWIYELSICFIETIWIFLSMYKFKPFQCHMFKLFFSSINV